MGVTAFMETESQIRFLDLVPQTHSRVQGWTIRTIRSKDVQDIKTLNVRSQAMVID